MHQPSRRRTLLLLILVFAGALGLRIWNADFGLPNQFAPDEVNKLRMAQAVLKGDLNTYKKQPAFLLYCYAAARGAAEPFRGYMTEKLPLRFAGPQGERSYQLWVGRLLMAFFGAATCVATFLLGRKAWSTTAGILAAALFAVTPLGVAVTHYIKEDNPVTLLLPLVLWSALGIAEKPCRSRLLLGGVLSGFAFGAKYSGGISLIVILAALWLGVASASHATPCATARQWFRKLWLPLAGFLAGFALFCPFHVIHAFEAISGVAEQTGYMTTVHHDGIGVSALEQYFTFYLRHALLPGGGLLALLLAAAGSWRLWITSRNAGYVLIGWTILYWLLIECSPAKPYPFPARYAMLLLPPLCVLAAIGGVTLRWRREVGIIATVLVVALPLLATLRAQLSARNDTRDQAAAWIQAHVPRGSVILTHFSPYTPPMQKGDYQTFNPNPEGVQQLIEQHPQETVFAIASSFHYERYLQNPNHRKKRTRIYQVLFEKGEKLADFGFPAGPFGFHSPRITILRIDPKLLFQPARKKQSEQADAPSNDGER